MEKLLQIRYVYLAGICFTFLNSIVFLLFSILDAAQGYQILLNQLDKENRKDAAVSFMESLDKFLVSLVFLIFSLGILKLLFYDKIPSDKLPKWLHIEDFKDLKVLLWETILVTLVVLSISLNVKNLDHLTWDILILPVSILVLAIGLILMQKA